MFWNRLLGNLPSKVDIKDPRCSENISKVLKVFEINSMIIGHTPQSFMFNEKIVLGAAYRWDAAMSAMLGFQLSDSWFIGYGYDGEVTKLANYNSGSHELFLRF